MGETIKLRKKTITILKGLNSSPITATVDYDYVFVVYLITDIFGEDVLENSAVYQQNMRGFYQRLDKTKYQFLEGKKITLFPFNIK